MNYEKKHSASRNVFFKMLNSCYHYIGSILLKKLPEITFNKFRTYAFGVIPVNTGIQFVILSTRFPPARE
jgi:hypothetical protein